jgi:RimJ/RimL family protein N-acetyltransferase
MSAVGPEVIHGHHVTLRPLVAEDAALTLAWRLSDRTTYLNRGAGTLAEQVAWIESRPPNERNFVIELRSGTPVGMVSLIAIDPANRRAEPARFLIGEPDAVRGIPVAVEAMQLIYALAFDELHLQRVYGTVASDNRLMIKWQRSFGMQEEGRLRRHLFLDGRFQDAVCLGLLEEEYRAVALPRMNALIRRP